MSGQGELVFGVRPVAEVLASGRRKAWQLFVDRARRGPQIDELSRLAARRGLGITRVDGKEIENMARGLNHQGVVLRAQPLSEMSLDEALELPRGKTTVWLAIDGITDPQNLGSILRSAACLGASCVLLPERRTAGLTPVVQKAASGALETLNIVTINNLNRTLSELKEKGFWVYGADMTGKSITTAAYNTPLVLVIGSEGEGMRLKTGEHCDELVSIPHCGGVESLNAACACAVILYDISAKIRAAK